MGGCASTEEDKSTTTVSSFGEDEKDTTASTIQKIATTWQGDTAQIWSRTFDKLAIHTDLPRLAHKMEVIISEDVESSNHSVESAKGEELRDSMTQEEVVYYVFCKLGSALESEEQQVRIKEQFKEYVKGVGDMSQQILRFLADVVGDDSKIMKVLKACHQKILLPGYYYVKSQIYEDYPFKDYRGSWTIRIVVYSDTVVVIHRKKQQSNSEVDGIPDFEFEWELRMGFDKSLSAIQHLSAKVVDMSVNDKLPDEKKQHINSVFEKMKQYDTPYIPTVQ